MDRWKSTARKKLRHGESQKGEDQRWRSSEREKVRREKMQKRKGMKVTKHYVFPMFCGSGGWKSRLAKAAGAEVAGQMKDKKIAGCCGAKHILKSKVAKHYTFGPRLDVARSKKCTQSWRQAHFEVKSGKTHHVRTTFGRS